MTADTITWDSVRDEILSVPEVKAEYDALSSEFELARAVITLREGIYWFNSKRICCQGGYETVSVSQN
jgi:hypothetical protein